jgi:hypothetical protein
MFIIPLLMVHHYKGVHRHSAFQTHKGTAMTSGTPHALNRHVSSAPLHDHTTHTHGCDHHRHLHGHSHGHGCNCNNGNASLMTPALAHPHPPTGTLTAARGILWDHLYVSTGFSFLFLAFSPYSTRVWSPSSQATHLHLLRYLMALLGQPCAQILPAQLDTCWSH